MNRSRSCLALRVCSGALLLTLCAPVTAAACDTIQTARLDSTCVVMARQGQQGVWFAVKQAAELKKAFQLVPELRIQVTKGEKLNLRRESQISDLRGALQLTKDSLRVIEGTVAVAEKSGREGRQQAISARQSHDTWKWVWWGAGVASGALLAILVDRTFVTHTP